MSCKFLTYIDLEIFEQIELTRKRSLSFSSKRTPRTRPDFSSEVSEICCILEIWMLKYMLISSDRWKFVIGLKIINFLDGHSTFY